jgi:DNA-binding NarL/FixJ family response regulator
MPHPTLSAADPQPVRLLVIDDSPNVLAVLRGMLSGHPGLMVAATAASAEEGLEAIPCARPDVVLLDVRMPGMGGLAAVAHFKQGERPPLVLLLSLDDDLALRRAAERSGADALLAKSQLDAGRLRRLIDELDQRRRGRGRARRSERAHRTRCVRCDRRFADCRRCEGAAGRTSHRDARP